MTTWRVLTWNIQGAVHTDLDAITTVITGLASDVVAMQEVRHPQARGLAQRLGWRVLWTRKHHPYSPLIWWRSEGLALLTPHLLSEAVSVSIAPGVSTWTYRHRVAMAATVSRGDDRLRVANMHLATQSPDERIAQARRVIPIIGERRPAVAAGDFNAVNEVEVIREFGAFGLGGSITSSCPRPRA